METRTNMNTMKNVKTLFVTMVTSLVAITSAGHATAATPAVADGRIRVEFASPDSFTDIRDSAFGQSDSHRDFVLGELREFIRTRGERVLQNGLHLEVVVTDIDLAGDFEPWHGMRFDGIRVIKAIYPARVRLEFRLTDSTGQVVAAGTRSLSDFGQPGILSTTFRSDSLRYEKDLIGNWLNSEFRSQRKT